MQVKTLLFEAFLFACALLPLQAQGKADSCDADDPFQLRAELAANSSSELCHGIVDASLGRQSSAERELKWAIRRMPRSSSSHRAHETLFWMYFREGKYRSAKAQLDQLLAENPEAKDPGSVHSLFAALAQYPAQKAVESRPSTVRSETIDNNLFLPVTVNGIAGSYIADTGTNISVICESEARRLGLRVQQTGARLSGAGGLESSYTTGAADAPDFWIGKTHLQHVAFTVVPDSSLPFADLPEGHKGLLGIPVLIALSPFRLDRGSLVEIRPSEATTGQAIPLAFDGAMPVTQVSLGNKTMSFTFDTGAYRTDLFPAFATLFPALMRTGSKQKSTLRGFAGNSAQEAVELPLVKFRFGTDVVLKSARVLLNDTTAGGNGWAAGNLGFDLISQAIPIVIDFDSMQLHVDSH